MLLRLPTWLHSAPAACSTIPALSSIAHYTTSTVAHTNTREQSDSNTSSTKSSSQQEQAWDESQYLQEYEEQLEFDEQEEQQQPVDRQQLLRQVLRRTHAAEAAMTHVLSGLQMGLRGRPDAAWFAQQEQQALESVQQLLPKYHVRPSALLSVLQAAGVAAGAAAALVPQATRNAAIAALQESLTDLNNDSLRLLREAGLSDEAPEVRAVLLKLRDMERAAEGATPPPDLLTLQQAVSENSLAAAGVTGVVGAVVKAAADAAIAATTKV